MAQRVREFEWGSTALGDVDSWPPELKAAVGYLLECKFPSAIVWGPALTTIYNDSFLSILGEKKNTLGKSFADIWQEAWPEISLMVEQAYSGEAVFVENFPLVIDRHDRPEQAYFTFCYSPLRMADGSIGGMMDTVVETTETMNARAHSERLSEELTHRLKNTIAVVQSIARQTLRSAIDRELMDAFENRLSALSVAHDALTKEGWVNASVKSIAEAALSLISDRKQIDLEACDVEVGPKAALTLSLLLHELATNADKYGALSNDAGRVRVRFEVRDGSLVLNWEEHGGPPVEQPTRRGFGSRIINLGLGGKVDYEFRPSGLVLQAEAPLSELQRP
ncbi:histidine kinase [Hyphomicrobium sp. 1Nfss2.1]|uniref:sensor histidine kinase n=1 Tax=Hyphomicrobium sp. 1Nfss2.1 TaxID=3413936 RepID=UPI003C7A1B50